jgi:SAM-dependent methyltransferase
MNPSDRAAYAARYRERLARYGHDPRTLGWMNGRQALRFDALLSACPLEAVGAILDVGCGFGDLSAHLRARGWRGRYTGIDFIPDLIEVGRKAHPGADLRVADAADLGGEEFDLVLASGIFNAPLVHEDSWQHLSETLATMFQRCRVAAASDFLSSYVDYRDPGVLYTSPERVFSLAKSLTRRVRLLHDYLPFEFAVALYRDDTVRPGARFRTITGPE